ncbi:MAG: sigma-70 family RNA polymerase sigma factor [Spirochaetales bacterium]|nr:sigma-70 family RNA polymerase sigma factor [Spirochaetales bacterium]
MAINVEEFYSKYGPMVLRRCRALLRDEEAALDAMQDVFVQVLRKEKQLHGGAPSSLLYTIATNICLNKMRKQKRTPLNAEDEFLQQVAGVDDPERMVLTNHFLDRLFAREKDSTRMIAVLHYVDNFTLEETAEKVGMSVSGVRKRLRNLREKGLALREV